MTVYLLHFETKLAHAQHYLGSTDNLEARLHCHYHGQGARLMAVVTELGITWQVARTLAGRPQAGTRVETLQGLPAALPHLQSSAANHKPSPKE